jgi:hypothetical protein
MNFATSIVFTPLVSWPVLAPLGLLALIVAGYALYRRARGGWLRLAFLTALFLLIANPSLIREERAPVSDTAVILLDESPSQAIGERRARGEAALARLSEQLAREPDLDLRVVRVGGGAEGRLDETRMIEALEKAMADVPTRRRAGAILITDGQVHDIPGEPARLASDFGPIHALLTGTRDERDRRIAILSAPSFGLVGKPVDITLKIEDSDPNAPGAVALAVTNAKGEREQITAPVGQEFTLTFGIDHGGQNLLEIEVETAPGEISAINNKAMVVVNGVRERLRVLLVSGEPHNGERTWRNILKSDPSVDLVHFTILRPPDKQDGTPIRELSLIAFPIRELFEIKLDEFDLVIFDQYRRRGVLPPVYYENIANYVREGGALLEASGESFSSALSVYRTALGQVLPGEPTGGVLTEGFRPRVTELGRRHPVTADLPGDVADGEPRWGRWFRLVEVTPGESQVVMEGPDARPLLMLARVGEGRVAQIASDQIWLWSRGFEGGGPQVEVLRRVAHWLMKEPELEDDVLRMKIDGNRLTIERRRLATGKAELNVTSPSGAAQTLAIAEDEPAWVRKTLAIDELGVWRASDGERTAFAVAGAINPPETLDMRTSDEKLRPLVEASGGGVQWLAETPTLALRRVAEGRDAAGRGWVGLTRNGDFTVTGVSETSLLPVFAALALALGLAAAAWRREGR